MLPARLGHYTQIKGGRINEGRNMFAHDHEVTMGGEDALAIALPWAAADTFRRSLGKEPLNGILLKEC
jgi:hypothetical protein